MNKLPQARIENIVVQEINDEILVFDLISNKARCLNEITKLVWQSCDGQITFDEFREKHNPDFSDELIWLVIDQLAENNLLTKDFQRSKRFNGLTRREIIRIIGLTSMIALPIMTSIAAPSSTMAQSVCQAFTCQIHYQNQCGDLSDNCGGQVKCDCVGIRNCSGMNCLCPDPTAAGLLPELATFCAGRCNQQIFIGSDILGNLVVGGVSQCPVNCTDCGSGLP